MGQNNKEIIGVLKFGTVGESVKVWQQFLTGLEYYSHKIDGQFNLETYKATKKFQSLNGLKQDGIVGERTKSLLSLENKLLKLSSYTRASEEIDIDVHLLQAVAEVESFGAGFIVGDGRPAILFEAHKFHKHTGGKYSETHPHISTPKWERSLYKGGADEYGRLAEAMVLSKSAAYKSTSWGKFQILGENFRSAGFQSVYTFVDAMYESEEEHLTAFINFLKNEKLDKPLRERDFSEFARGYNGPGYQKNSYHYKIQKAFLENKSNADLEMPIKELDFELGLSWKLRESFTKHKFNEF